MDEHDTICDVALYNVVWISMIQFGVVWAGMVYCGTAWYAGLGYGVVCWYGAELFYDMVYGNITYLTY